MRDVGRLKLCAVVLACWAVGVRESAAELQVESSEQLSYLVNGMEASLNRIETIQADITATEVYEVTGKPRVDIINKTQWISKGPRHKYETQLTQLHDGELPPKPIPGQKHAPIGEQFTECAYSGEVFVESEPTARKAIIRLWEKSPGGTLQERAYHEPYFYGTQIKGLSLADLVLKGRYWHALPESRDPAATRQIRWAGKREYKGRQTEAIEMVVKWKSADGTRNEQRYEILVEPDRGFTVPFISTAYAANDGPLEVFETIQTECVPYGDNLWGAKRTEVVNAFTTQDTPGKSKTVITVDTIKFNIPVTDEQLKVNLVDGTRVDDQVAGVTYTYGTGAEDDVLKAIEESLRQANLGTAIPIGATAVPPSRNEPEASGEAGPLPPGALPRQDPNVEQQGKGRSLALWIGFALGALVLVGWVSYRRQAGKHHSGS